MGPACPVRAARPRASAGRFSQAKKFLATAWLWLGYLYLAAMIAAMIARARSLWDRPIPIVLHWVLAAFVITVGISHRRRLER